MYSREAFELLISFIMGLEETDFADEKKILYEIETADRSARKEFGEALLAILKGFLASDPDTQQMMYLTGLTNGLLDKKLVETVIALHCRERGELIL